MTLEIDFYPFIHGITMVSKPTAAKIVTAAEFVADLTDKLTGFVCVVCFVIMTFVALLGVFFRYVMQSPFMWTEEVARYLLVWMGFVAISIALRQDKHIKIEIIAKFTPLSVQTLIGYGVDILIAVFMIVFLKQGYLLMTNNIMTAPTLSMSMSWILLALPVSATLVLIQLFLRVVVKIFSGLTPEPDTID